MFILMIHYVIIFKLLISIKSPKTINWHFLLIFIKKNFLKMMKKYYYINKSIGGTPNHNETNLIKKYIIYHPNF